jgi:hypothetical protein
VVRRVTSPHRIGWYPTDEREPGADGRRVAGRRRTLVTRNPACVVWLAFLAVPLGGCLTPKALDPTPADRKAIVTIEDFSDWLHWGSVVLEAEVDDLTKQKVAWSTLLSYEYRGAATTDEAKPLPVVLQSEVSFHPNAVSARHNFDTYGVGLGAGIRKAGGTFDPVKTTFLWGDEMTLYAIEMNGRQIGNGFIGRSGRVATYVLISGLYSSDPTHFEAVIAPVLSALERYDPDAAADLHAAAD